MLGIKILVFAKQKEGKLNFGLNCTNSTLNGLTKKDIDRLIHANKFNILSYHFNYDIYMFNDAKPVTNIDSLIIKCKSSCFVCVFKIPSNSDSNIVYN